MAAARTATAMTEVESGSDTSRLDGAAEEAYAATALAMKTIGVDALRGLLDERVKLPVRESGSMAVGFDAAVESGAGGDPRREDGEKRGNTEVNQLHFVVDHCFPIKVTSLNPKP